MTTHNELDSICRDLDTAENLLAQCRREILESEDRKYYQIAAPCAPGQPTWFSDTICRLLTLAPFMMGTRDTIIWYLTYAVRVQDDLDERLRDQVADCQQRLVSASSEPLSQP
ncbi:hypothetical protein N7513_003223 [Penicillium frequentans]|uniref:Uncharacterized protein n=1 Tax=Penicillium frequentans TaxID=3151616 RepID=A0AAD6CHX0_9EURO|nr:hypothetical protein N7494_013236 [Penicillium glabrum]KAJ5557637.1 hypothetical protein N7513_003223 [Penicillium glabrum]